jgi:hypothetical protein
MIHKCFIATIVSRSGRWNKKKTRHLFGEAVMVRRIIGGSAELEGGVMVGFHVMEAFTLSTVVRWTAS